MTDIGSGIPDNLLSSAIWSASSRLLSFLARRQSVFRVLSEKSYDKEINPIIVAAINDMKQALGRAGRMTAPLAGFLDELAACGFLDYLSRLAFFDLDTDDARFQFDLLFSRHFAPEKNMAFIRDVESGKPLFDVIFKMLKRSVDVQIGPQLRFIFQGDPKLTLPNIRSEVARYEKAPAYALLRPKSNRDVDAAALELPSWISIPRDEIERFLAAYYEAASHHYGEIIVFGPHNKYQAVPIDKIFVPSRVNYITNPRNLVYRDNLTAGPSLGDIVAQALTKPPNRLSFDKILLLYPHTVVIGNPGSGKSTLTKKICFLTLLNGEVEARRFAIQIELRQFAQRGATGRGSLIEFIGRQVLQQTNIPFPLDKVSECVNYLLFMGRCTIIFDGIDEILNHADRIAIQREITQFISFYRLSSYIITCRKVDFANAPILGFPVFEVDDFNAADVREYFRLSAVNIYGIETSDLKDVEERFVVEAKSNAAEFISSPLLLSLIVWIYHYTKRIPDNRVEIYRECSELLFDRWDAFKKLESELPTRHYLFQLLPYLARRMYLKSPSEGPNTRAWLFRTVKEFFLTVYSEEREARAEMASKLFVEHLAGRAWVLQERGTDIFEFTHRTFLEYFFAKSIDGEYETINEGHTIS